jgi:hypothetical protein
MSTSSISRACGALALTLLFAGAAMAQGTTLDAACTPQMTRLLQRLYQKAEEGPGVLRDFIDIRRRILQLDIYETAVWAESVTEARAACMKKVVQEPGVGPGTAIAVDARPATEIRR